MTHYYIIYKDGSVLDLTRLVAVNGVIESCNYYLSKEVNYYLKGKDFNRIELTEDIVLDQYLKESLKICRLEDILEAFNLHITPIA